jgi:hypothetical protein
MKVVLPAYGHPYKCRDELNMTAMGQSCTFVFCRHFSAENLPPNLFHRGYKNSWQISIPLAKNRV